MRHAFLLPRCGELLWIDENSVGCTDVLFLYKVIPGKIPREYYEALRSDAHGSFPASGIKSAIPDAPRLLRGFAIFHRQPVQHYRAHYVRDSTITSNCKCVEQLRDYRYCFWLAGRVQMDRTLSLARAIYDSGGEPIVAKVRKLFEDRGTFARPAGDSFQQNLRLQLCVFNVRDSTGNY